MKRAQMAFVVLAVVGLGLAWNALLLSPKSDERAELKQQVASARSTGDGLRAELEALRQAELTQEEDQAKLDRIRKLMPTGDGMAEFIRALDELEARTQVDWATLSPAAAPAKPGQAATTTISLSVAGTFFELLDYLDGLAALDRLVVVDSVQLSGGAGSAAGGEATLQAAVSGRIFSAGTAPSPGVAADQPAAADTVAAAPSAGGN